MISLLQRVSEARVVVEGAVIGEIGAGLLVLVCAERGDSEAQADKPSFTQAAAPDDGRRLYDYLVDHARATHPVVQTGRFATDMKVHLVNDGPVTIPLWVN